MNQEVVGRQKRLAPPTELYDCGRANERLKNVRRASAIETEIGLEPLLLQNFVHADTDVVVSKPDGGKAFTLAEKTHATP